MGAIGLLWWAAPVLAPAQGPSASDLLASIERVDRVEEVLLDLLPTAERLEGWIGGGDPPLDRILPDALVMELAPAPESVDGSGARALDALGVRRWRWHAADEPGVPVRAAAPWPSLSAWTGAPVVADLHLDDGDFVDGDGERFRTTATLTLRAAGRVATMEIVADWRLDAGGWQVETLAPAAPARLFEARETWFAEVAEQALGADEAEAARRSQQEEWVRAMLQDPEGFDPPHPAFHAVSHDRHPAVSVTDLDRDGWDDLYLMPQWGRNRFYRNRGDGTFEEVAERLGLDIPSHTSCALFLDFDNDGDLDAFLCRTLERSRLLEQRAGRFVDVSATAGVTLPKYVASASAADVDGDGLLDLYVATYTKKLTLPLSVEGVVAIDPSLPQPTVDELAELIAKERNNVDSAGPANVLLRNTGGLRFKDATRAANLVLFRHTYQAAWSDIDVDGDVDLYLANDYGPNNLYRNLGDGTFEDVTAPSGTADRGFGMGVAWGDYDGDGREDLYVSNMYSRAGSRITRKIAQLEPVFAKMAGGNTLFRNVDGDRFAVVSGSDPGDLAVERTGWSWGGQFADVDNDGWLDLAVLNGYYTAPDVVTPLPVDT